MSASEMRTLAQRSSEACVTLCGSKVAEPDLKCSDFRAMFFTLPYSHCTG